MRINYVLINNVPSTMYLTPRLQWRNTGKSYSAEADIYLKLHLNHVLQRLEEGDYSAIYALSYTKIPDHTLGYLAKRFIDKHGKITGYQLNS